MNRVHSSLQAFPETVKLWPLRGRLALALLAGVLCFPAMPPWTLWPLLGAGLTLAYILLNACKTSRQAALTGWLFAFGYFGPGLSWIANALLVDGNPFSWVWPLAIAGLPALLAVFYAFTFWLLHKSSALTTVSGWIAFFSALSATELVRGHIFTGFPWNLFGYTWANTPAITQLVSVIGTYGLTFLTLVLLSLPGFLWLSAMPRKRKMMAAGIAVVVFSFIFLWGQARLAANPSELRSDVVVRIIQPDISQADKWNPQKTGENLRKLFDLSAADSGNALATTAIIWPETAISSQILKVENVSAALKETLSTYTQPVFLLSGVLRREESDDGTARYFNSLMGFDQDLYTVQTYDKSHLVPFGEYIPFDDIIPLAPFVKFSGFEEGAGIETQSIPGLFSYSPLVCYEIIFPGAVVKNDAQRPELLLNVTNDAWYGDSAGPHQHFAKTRFRAIEEGIPAARSANTGISGMIDPYGRVLAKADLFTEKALNVALPKSTPDTTIYSRTGDMPLVIILVLAFLFFTLKGRRHNPKV